MIMAIAGALERERVRRGLSKKDLASLAGLNRSAIVRAEQGISVSPKTVKKLCDFFDMPLEALFSIVSEGEGV